MLNILISILRNKAAAVLIGPLGMGLADLYFRAIELLSNSTNFGLGMSGLRALSKLYETGDKEQIASNILLIRTCVLFTAILGTLLTICLSPCMSQWFFNDSAHILDLCAIAPAVAFSTLTGGELVILRSMRRLKQMATLSAGVAVGTLVAAIVLYSIWGIKGVIPVILCTTLLTFLLYLSATHRDYPYRIAGWKLLVQGKPLFALGLSFVGAGIISSGAEMVIRLVVVNSDGGIYAAGIYAAGITLTVSYARMIFVAMDADYFPRLSASSEQHIKQNETVNSQMNVLALLMAPFLIAFALCLPIIVPLLYSSEYLCVMPMVLAALPSMFFKSLYSPIAYLSLAHGDSRLYFLMELIYNLIFVIAVSLGYHFYGFWGAGIGISLAHLCDLLILFFVYRKKYQYRLETKNILIALVQAALLFTALACIDSPSPYVHYGAGGAVCTASITFSLLILKRLRDRDR